MELDVTELSKHIIFEHTREDYSIYKMNFHLHNKFEIYFFIRGSVNYFIEKSVYRLKYGNLLIMNDHEIHRSCPEDGVPYERIIIHFHPSLLKFLSTEKYDLSSCFLDRETGKNNLFLLNEAQINTLLGLFYKMEALDEKKYYYEHMKFSYFIEILVFINEIFKDSMHREENNVISSKLKPILDYIDTNLEQNLSLDHLVEKFFINKYYLSRLFKNTTGSNLNDYIRYKRLSRAKSLLAEGRDVTETCVLSGFNDYSHFIRTFRNTVGVSPGKYRKTLIYPSHDET